MCRIFWPHFSKEIMLHKLHTLKHIETPRLIIRPVQLGDEVPLNKNIKNSLASLQKWMPWANHPNLDTTRDFIQRSVYSSHSETITEFPMVAIHKKDKKIIACSGYNPCSKPPNGVYEISYWCDVDYQGKGYITECVNAITRYTLGELKAKTVVIATNINNLKSIAIAERLNFVNKGIKPSTIREKVTNFYFTCETIDNLPPLDISISYCTNNNSQYSDLDLANTG